MRQWKSNRESDKRKGFHKQSNIGSATAVRMIRCLAKTPQLLGPSVTFDLGKASKKSDNYHFWGWGGGQQGSFITFFLV